jgi:hypothetical protein
MLNDVANLWGTFLVVVCLQEDYVDLNILFQQSLINEFNSFNLKL